MTRYFIATIKDEIIFQIAVDTVATCVTISTYQADTANNMKQTTLTANVLTRFTNLKKRDAAYRDVYIALKSELNSVVKNGGDKQPTLDKLQASYDENKQVNIKLARMREKYGKIEAVALAQDSYTLALKYPRDGMGRLYLSDNFGFTTYARGCGYDKRGTVLGHWINEYFGNALAALNDIQLEMLGYGVNRSNGCTWADGGCGESCMYSVVEALGYTITAAYTGSPKRHYIGGYVITKAV